jgi:glyoxylase-like metal-dependent hydrolase (beta-lactamase superfamily II)
MQSPLVIDLNFLGHTDTIAAFLWKTTEGFVLIETGPHSTFPQLCERLGSLGLTPEDIQHVFLTHIHLDHAGAAWEFAKRGAQVYLHPLGKKHMVDPSRLYASAKRIYQDDMDRLWGKLEPIPEDQLITLEQGQSVSVGGTEITAHHTPGHAIHHIAWMIEGHLFTGDVAGAKIGNGPVMPPCPPPDIDLEAWDQSLDLIRSLQPNTLWLTHYGPSKEVDDHLNQLQERLHRYADWIRPFANSESIPKDQLVKEYQEMVAVDLRQNGVKGEGIIQYEHANPAWMSVEGLLRYWRKKDQ